MNTMKMVAGALLLSTLVCASQIDENQPTEQLKSGTRRRLTRDYAAEYRVALCKDYNRHVAEYNQYRGWNWGLVERALNDCWKSRCNRGECEEHLARSRRHLNRFKKLVRKMEEIAEEANIYRVREWEDERLRLENKYEEQVWKLFIVENLKNRQIYRAKSGFDTLESIAYKGCKPEQNKIRRRFKNETWKIFVSDPLKNGKLSKANAGLNLLVRSQTYKESEAYEKYNAEQCKVYVDGCLQNGDKEKAKINFIRIYGKRQKNQLKLENQWVKYLARFGAYKRLLESDNGLSAASKMFSGKMKAKPL